MVNIRDITFGTIVDAVRHQWKTFLITLILFGLLGLGSGFLFSKDLSAPAAGQADPLKSFGFNFEKERQNRDYIGVCKGELIGLYTDTTTYVNTVMQEKTLTKEQTRKLKDCIEKLTHFQKTTIQSIEDTWNLAVTPFFPAAVLERELAMCEKEKKNLRWQLIEAEEAVRLVSAIQAPAFSNETLDSTYTNLLVKAESYGSLVTRNMKNDALLDQLKNHAGEIVQRTEAMEQQLKNAGKELNELQKDIKVVMDEIVSENHLNIDISYETDSMQVSVSHTSNETTPQDAFCILLIFCTLLGAGLGLYLSIAKEAKRCS